MYTFSSAIVRIMYFIPMLHIILYATNAIYLCSLAVKINAFPLLNVISSLVIVC